MAEKLSDSVEEKRLDLLKEIEEANQRIEEQNKKAAVVGAEERKRLEKRIEREKEKLKELQKQVKPLEEQNTLAEEYNDLQDTLQSSFTKLDIGARKLIQTNKLGGTAFASLATDILNIKDEQAGLSEDELKNNQKKLDVYTSLYTSITQQAEAASDIKNELTGQSAADSRRLQFEESIANLGDKEKRKLTDLFDLKENLIQQEQRLKQIQSEGDDLYQKLPAFLQDGVDMAKKFGKAMSTGMLPIVAIAALLGAALASFTELEGAAGKFREETGLTKSQTKDISNQVREIRAEFAGLGIEAKDVYDTFAALKAEFSDSTASSKAVAANITLLNKQFAISQKDAAAVNMIFQSMAGLSAETSQGVAQQVAQMANLAGVAPAKVFNDIAESAADTYTYFKGDVNLIAKQAVEARRLGSNLKDVLKTTEGLLDFQNGIEKELVAATFVGGQFNLSQARALAYAGKHVDAQKEILRQVERNGKFADQDVFTKRALADAAGMSVEQITKQLAIQEKLSGLSDADAKRAQAAIDKGVDITNLTQDQLMNKTKELEKEQEIADKITQMENSFKGIVASVGEGLVPLMNGLAPVITMVANAFGFIFKVLNFIPGLFPAIIAGLTTMYILSKKTALLKMKEAIMSAWSNSKWGVAGIALAVGATAAIMAAYSKGGTDVGDMAINSGKGVQISTAEGGIFNPSPNDQIAVAPNAVSRLSDMGKGTLATVATKPAKKVDNGVQHMKDIADEIKSLRGDMNAGKIGVYMDGQRVMTGIAVASERTTRNNFTYGQRY